MSPLIRIQMILEALKRSLAKLFPGYDLTSLEDRDEISLDKDPSKR